MWVAERLAEYLVTAGRTGLSSPEPWQYALERLRVGGVDTTTWIPSANLWSDALNAG
jgi:hypothetical protein